MNSFLRLTANDLWQRTAGDMTSVTIVFPNKRAALFFNEHLARQTDRPTWTPCYTTISELFRSLTHLKTGDPIKLVSDLYKVYTAVTGTDESLDSFYFWGEILISDFDDADKNLVDTPLLFRNLKDLGELSSDYDFLDKEQQEAIRQFFRGYSAGGDTPLKSKFSAIWNSLGKIYEDFKALLSKQGIAYEGMIYRQVIDNLDPESLPSKTYAFVGFNVLNKVEQRLFSLLQKAGKAFFYWDYDIFYLKRSPHEAGEFMRRNLHNFPSPLPESLFDCLSTPKDIAFIDSPTDTGQAAYVSDWIARHLTKDDPRQTAIVLCDERLLLPVLHSIPDIVSDINITMGYPLSQTQACSLAIDMLDKSTGDDNLQLCQEICNAVKELAQSDPHTSGLNTESCFRTYTIFTRLSTLIQSGDLIVEPHTLRRLAKRLLSAATVPFHGEPARGLQVMGVLETRNLDFRNVLMLSVNEGKLPKGENTASFIPYNLRKAFGMTTVDHRVAVYAYYFYRLIQRCQHVTMIYTTITEGTNRGEMSRFMLQLMTELPYEINNVRAGRVPARNNTTCDSGTRRASTRQERAGTRQERAGTRQERAGTRQERAGTRQERAGTRPAPTTFNFRLFTPSALNTYLTCRMKFFFNYVAGLKPYGRRDNAIDAAHFGTIFHKAAQLVYQDLRHSGNLITKEALTTMLNKTLQNYVDQAFREQYDTITGSHLIASKVIAIYLKRLLTIDASYAPFNFLDSEHWVSHELSCPEIKTRIGGIIDRIDSKGDTIRIVDYKTGGKPSTVPNVESLFLRNGEHDDYAFQTFLYSSILCDIYPDKKIIPAILYIHKAAADDYSPTIMMGPPRSKQPVTDFRPLNDEFRKLLTELVSEILSPDTSFYRTDNEDSCRYCDFRYLCKS